MIDPITLFEACRDLTSVLQSLYNEIRNTGGQNPTIQVLRKEVKLLLRTVEKMQALEDESLAKAMEATEFSHWKDVKTVLSDCRGTILKLCQLIASPEESRNVLIRGIKFGMDLAKAKWNYPAIDLLQKELRSHRDSLNLSITCALRGQQQLVGLTSRIDEILSYIRHNERVLDQLETIETETSGIDTRTTEWNTFVVGNIRKSVESAEAFVRNAPTVARNLARHESTQIGSESSFSAQQRTVERWLSTPLPVPDEIQVPVDESGESDEEIEVASLSRNLENGVNVADPLKDFFRIKRTRDLAAREIRLTNYRLAELYLTDVKSRSDEKYGLRYAWKDETIELLTMTYSRQGKWDEAEQLLRAALNEIVGRERESQALQLYHALAQMYLDKGDFVKAEVSALQAMYGRTKLLGASDVSTYQSRYLLVRIYYATRNDIKLRRHLESLPKDYPYWTEDCEEVESLIRMSRLEAADSAVMGMLRSVLTDTHSGELEAIIATGGVTASGGYSLVHALTEHGEPAALRVLLEHGADSNARDGDDQTPLHIAAALDENGENVVKVLLNHHADVEAITKRDHETPLIIAVKSGRLDNVRLLLENGAEPEMKDRLGYAAIHHAVFRRTVNVLRFLLKNNVRVDSIGHYGRTALHLAASRGDDTIVKLLKNAGANLKIRDASKKTPLNLAENEGHESTVRILKGLSDLHPVEETPKSKTTESSTPPGKLRKRAPDPKNSLAFHPLIRR